MAHAEIEAGEPGGRANRRIARTLFPNAAPRILPYTMTALRRTSGSCLGRPRNDAPRRRLGWTACLAATVCIAASGCRTAPVPLGRAADAPARIVVLDIDTLRASHLGCYGYERDTSPEIDAFAEKSVRFKRAFSQAPNTPPSQATILTGLYPSTHGLTGKDERLSGEIATLAETLRNDGFETAAFVDGGFMKESFGLDQGFELYDDSREKGLETIGPKVFDWVRANAGEDFLLLVHTYDVHAPYGSPPEPYRSMFLEGLDAPTAGFEATAEQLEEVRTSTWSEHPKRLPPNDLAWAKALYDGGIRYVDAWIGELFDELRDLGIFDDSLIVLISDHGEEFGEHGSVLHEKLYATVTQVPFVLRFPGGERAGEINEEVGLVDLMPTLLEWSGVEIPPGVQGRSLLGAISRGARIERGAYSESPFFNGQYAFASAGYHLVSTGNPAKLELFYLTEDPTAQVDVARKEPGLVKRMRERMRFRQAEIAKSRAYRPTREVLDAETLDELRALGYVE
jgi:arylsulfatase A-like enzyme